jgi:hypothetical protein
LNPHSCSDAFSGPGTPLFITGFSHLPKPVVKNIIAAISNQSSRVELAWIDEQ